MKYIFEGIDIGRGFPRAMALAMAVMPVGFVGDDSAFAKVDVDKLTVSVEARIRYEYRVGATFGSSVSNESASSHRIRSFMLPPVSLIFNLINA